MTTFSHLKALLLKQWILWRRNSLGSFLEIAIPILFALVFLVFRHAEAIQSVQSLSYSASPYLFTQPSIPTPFLKNCQTEINGGKIGLSPPNDPIIQDLKDIFESRGETVQLFPSNEAIDDFVKSPLYGEDDNKLCYAVVMKQNNIQDRYQYLIRFNISTRPGREDIPNTNNPRVKEIEQEDLDSLYKYATSGFLTIQTWIDTLILRRETQQPAAIIQASVASVSVPAHQEDDLMVRLIGTSQYFIALPLLLPFLRMVNGILKEKEKRIREGMRIMGLKNIAFYMSWFITYFIIMTGLSLAISIILNLGFFVNSSLGWLFLFHWEYSICLTALGILITVFFNRAKLGNILAFVIVFLLQWVDAAVSGDDVSPNQRFWSSIAPPTSVSLAGNQILALEASQQGLTSSTVDLLFLRYKMSYHYIWMAIDIVMFLVLTIYLDQVLPREFGVRKHPLFFLFRPKKKTIFTSDTEVAQDRDELLDGESNFEETDPALKVQDQNNESIIIRDLKKIYGNGKVAVDGVSYNMYRGQIFALLGHNGAGKTTTISMITGLYAATEGTVTVFGMDLHEQLDSVRKIMGVCPQHDILYDDLTVKEHLELFAHFKGMDSKDIPQEVEKLIADLDLQEKRDYLAKNLSGGQRRRLSIAIAFVGGSKFIILDEPSSGMDTSARRRLWDMLKNYKHGRVVLLTTHFMDEADYLGDRIGIMGEGKMQCLGSSLFLKNKFGVGYTLTLSKKQTEDDSKPVVEFIRSYIPEAKVVSNVSSEISLQLPLETVSKFKDLFTNLDDNLIKLKINNYGVSVTTLEQVFLNVAHMSSRTERNYTRQLSNSEDNIIKSLNKQDFNSFDLCEERIKSPWALFKTQFGALVIKRLNYFRRDRRGLILELLLPVILIIAGILLTKADFIPPVKHIELKDDLYGQPFDVRYNNLTSPSSDILSGFNQKTFNLIEVESNSRQALDLSVFQNRNIVPISKFNMYFDVLNNVAQQYQYLTLVDTRAQEASPFALNKINNAILKFATGNSNKRISVVVSPFEHTEGVKAVENALDGLSLSFVFSIGMSFIPASLVTFIVKEREIAAKHQQLISGVSVRAYWFANYFVDIIKYLIPGVINSLMALAFNAEGLIKGEKYGVVWALFILYGFSVTSFGYLTSFLFKDFGIAQTATFFFHFASGFVGGLGVGLLRIFKSTNNVALVLQWILRPLPTFALTYGLLNLAKYLLLNLKV